MIYINNESNDPYYNLAFEEYIFYNVDVSDTILLLWQNSPSVIVGKYQNTVEEIALDYTYENEVSVVRRNTGGGAVYHDMGNLNYSFIVPDVSSQIDFKTFTKPLIEVLNKQGIVVEQTGRNDITIDGCKFSGNAQQYHDGKLLHHGTIMFDVDLENVQKSLKVKPGKIESKGIKSVRSRVTNLKPYFKTKMNIDEFKSLLLKCFKEEYGIKEYQLSEKELEEIKILCDSKYKDWEWNYGKSPKADVMKSNYFKCGYIEFHFQLEQMRVKELNLVGDFFCNGEIEQFTNAFNGVKYSRTELMRVLETIDLYRLFGNITPDEIINVII